MFNERKPAILERCEDIMLVLIALLVPLVALPSMLAF